MSTPVAAATPPATGLSSAEAAARLAAEGPNELAQAKRRTPFRIAFEVVREPMLALLIAGGVVYLLLGGLGEALTLLAFALLSIGITVVQESRTERVLEALRDLSSPRALVIRDGVPTRIPGREVVRGDVVTLAEGDRVPADATLIEGSDLLTDESLLTGESAPVRKRVAVGEETDNRRPGGDDQPHVYAGSLVVRGSGLSLAFATGARTEIGRIGQSLEALETEPPRLQAQTRRIVKICAVAGGAVSLLAAGLYATLRGGWLEGLLAGIALGMSMMPEEFPVVLAVFMAMGAWRLSASRVLTRRASAIETLGSATVLCTDKTGTLTQNRMTVAELRLPDGTAHRIARGQEAAMPDAFRRLVAIGARACAPMPYDPMERAFHALAAAAPAPGAMAAGGDASLLRAYGLRPDLLAMSNVWRPVGAAAAYVAAKGAPEAIADLCRLEGAQRRALAASTEGMAAAGMRVLGVALAESVPDELPDSQRDIRYAFAGLVGLEDPLRPEAAASVAACRAAGIRVVMITGDYPATARAIAGQAGIDARTAISGEEIARLDDAALAQATRTSSVFARILPDQKLRIVQAMRAQGQVVAMTGDGVNDAPSLKAADIGIAMGGRGTDVAREASDLVLLDDDFSSIVRSVGLGRRIYDNLRKAIAFIFAVHVPIAGLALLPLAFGLPILLGPMHIALLEMVIDPVCSLVFEAETAEDDAMHRPPRAPDAPLFSIAVVTWSLLQGILTFALVATIFLVALAQGMPENEVRALVFVSLVSTILGLILVNRTFSASLLAAFARPNRTLLIVVLAVAALLAPALAWPPLRDLLGFGPLHAPDLAITLGAGIAVIATLEAIKPLWRSRTTA